MRKYTIKEDYISIVDKNKYIDHNTKHTQSKFNIIIDNLFLLKNQIKCWEQGAHYSITINLPLIRRRTPLNPLGSKLSTTW